jgi:hypothetical protein
MKNREVCYASAGWYPARRVFVANISLTLDASFRWHDKSERGGGMNQSQACYPVFITGSTFLISSRWTPSCDGVTAGAGVAA